MQFIINDTLKKLKGDNPLNASSQGLPHAVGSAVQQQFVYQASQNSQGSPQPQNQQHQPQPYHQLHTVLQATCSPTLAINNSQQQQQQQQQLPAAPVTVSVRSLLQAIPQIPAQPPICIFDDDESPTELPASGNIVILTEQPSASTTSATGLPCTGIAIAPSPSSCSSSTTTLSNLNSITSPSPVVPDLLLSTPPGVNSSLNSNNTTATTSHIFQHLQQQQQQHQSYSNVKKVDKRPAQSISNASGITSSHNQHHHHHLHIHQSQSHNHQNVPSSPTSSPSKRSKSSSSTNSNSKDCSYSSRSTALTSASPRAGAGTGFNSNTNNNASSTFSSSSLNNKRETTPKFFNIHDKIKELYLQLLSNDLNHFTETGVRLHSTNCNI